MAVPPLERILEGTKNVSRQVALHALAIPHFQQAWKASKLPWSSAIPGVIMSLQSAGLKGGAYYVATISGMSIAEGNSGPFASLLFAFDVALLEGAVIGWCMGHMLYRDVKKRLDYQPLPQTFDNGQPKQPNYVNGTPVS